MTTLQILLYIVLGLLAFIYFYLKRHFNYWQSRGIACEEPNWILGNAYGMNKTRSVAHIFEEYYNKFKGTGPFAGFYWFQSPSAFLLDPFLIKNVLIKDFSKFTDRGLFSNEADDPLSGQIFFLDGHRWKQMRSKLSPTFSSGKMKFMYPTVTRVAEEFIDVFAQMMQQNAIVEVKELLARFTTDVIGTCAFGIDCNSLKDPEAEFRIMGRKALTDFRHGNLHLAFLMSFPNLARKLHMKFTPDHIEAFFMRIVKETVLLREQNNIRRNDFMDQLIDLKNQKLMKSEDGEQLKNLSIEEVAAQAFVFFNAGFETSSTTMGFALYELAQHEQIQQKARDEVLQVLAKHNNELNYEAMKDLQYLDQIIWETLRLYTVLSNLSRQALEDYVVPGHPKYVIKKGMRVFIPSGAIHRDAEYYPNPNVFNPDNFSAEAVKQRDNILTLSFGEGPRNCIGMRFGQMQARIGLALLLKNFKFSVCEQTKIPIEYDVKSFLISSKGGIYLKVQKI